MAYKHDYDRALSRLVTILTKLYNGESLSVKELAIDFNVSTRTIQRDLNERLISFPIYQDKKLWRMQDGFRLEKTTSIEESIVLDIMEKLAESVGNNFSSKAKALLSKIKNDDVNPIYTKLDMEDIGDKLDIVQILESAIKSKQEITCQYKLDNNKIISSHLKPLKIANYEGFWYLICLDTSSKNKLKKFYLKNISNIKLLTSNFNIETKLEELLKNSISIWFNERKEPYEVKIFIAKEISKYIKRKPISPTQSIESIYEDGSMEIVIRITSDMEIIPLIKYWLPSMRVIEPQSLDIKIRNEIQGYLDTTNK